MRVAMFMGTTERCGVGEHARLLVEAMGTMAQVTPVAGSFGRLERAAYRKLGRAMNAGEIAHIQHAYAFWGGLAPHRARFGTFLREIRVPTVMTVHELDLVATGSWGLPAPLERAYKRVFNRLTFGSRRLHALVVHTPAVREGLVGLGIPESRVRLMEMPVPGVTRAPDRNACRALLELDDRFVVTIFGFLARRKGYDLALDALARLPAEYLLLIAGDAHPADPGDPRGCLEREVAARGLEERLRFLGYVPDERVPAVMAASDVVLAPFTRMTASASIHLALAHGRPVLASDLEANRRLPCLALFPTGDAEALATALEGLRSDPARRAALAEAAVAYAAEHGVERLARETIALYYELLAPK